MVVLKRRIFKIRKNKCCMYFKILVLGMIECLNCGEYKLLYCVCKNCGFYNGEEVVVK